MSRIRLIHHITYHPLGIEDARGHKVEVMRGGLRWSLRPGVVASGERGEER